MTSRSGWLILAVLSVAVGSLVLLQRAAPEDSPDHSSLSDGRNGTSALRQLAQQRGHPVSLLEAGFDLPDGSGTLFVFNPSSRFSAAETASLKTWLEKGGVLVYADDRLDPQLAVALDLHKTQVPASTDARAATPALVGVAMVTTNSFGPQFAATADQAVLLRGVVGRESVIAERVGQGRVIALATPELLCNGWLQVADNAILAADLESISAGPVLFDEFHHSFAGHDPAARGDWTRGPLGLGLVWGTLAVFLALLLRGRAFGPRLALGPEGPRSTAEYAVAVGHLLRLARGRQLALQLMAEATRRRLAARVGMGGEPTTTRLQEALERRAPNLGREFAAAQADAAGVPKSETALLRIARRLHDLAYPHAGKASTPGR